jgi:hypothetical protein
VRSGSLVPVLCHAPQIRWCLAWDELLTAELAWHTPPPAPARDPAQAPPAPDGVNVHRKDRCPVDGSLLYDVRCRPGTAQAQEVVTALLSTWYRYRRQNIEAVSAMVAPVLVTAHDRAMGQVQVVVYGDMDSRYDVSR